jgi:Helix-turn-helix domain
MSLQSIDAVLAHSQAKNSARLVLFVIAHHQNREGIAYLSISTLMRETNLAERSVQEGLKKLVALHELAIDYGKGPRGCNVYRILIHSDPRKLCGGRESSPAKFSQNGGQSLPPNLILKPYISDHTFSNGNGAHAPGGVMISPEVMRKFNLRYSTEDWPPPRRQLE